MSLNGLLNTIIVAVGVCLQAIILFLLLRSRGNRQFPWFFVYISYSLLESVLRLVARGFGSGYGRLYYNVYYWSEIGEVLLAVMAVRESFLNVFRAYTKLRWFLITVWGSVALALAYALARAIFAPPVSATRRGAVIIGLEVAVNYSLAAVGIVYLAMLVLAQIREHQWETGIVAGFTIYYSIGVFTFLLLSRFGHKYGIVDWIGSLAYIIAEIQWAVVLSCPERKALSPNRNLSIADLTRLGEYIKILGHFLGNKK
jgi:hypothetical protein